MATETDSETPGGSHFQSATADKFREIIERLTGRRVRAFVSGIDADVDICSEVFYLEEAD